MTGSGDLPADACIAGPQGLFGADRITRNSYNALDFLIKKERAVGTAIQNAVSYERNGIGQTTSLTDERGYKATMTYDTLGLMVRWTFPSKTAVGTTNATDYEEYAYDANGNRTSLRKRDGSVIGFTYDALNRLTLKTIPDRADLALTHTRDVFYSYDLRGLQTSATFSGAGTTAISLIGVSSTYDGFGRLASSTWTMGGIAFTRTLSYTRDILGNRTEMTWMDGQKTGYAYDTLSRMTALSEGPMASGIPMLGYTYNNRGLRSAMTARYGPASSYTYDAVGRLSALTHDLGGAATAQDVAYGLSYNPASQIASQSTSNDAYVYTGDIAVARNYAVNGLNQYVSAGPASFTYDANGNLTSDGTNSYTYDVENRLVTMTSAAGTATLRYEPLGRLFESTSTSGVVTRYHYDGDELVAEFDVAGNMLRRYAHGSGVDDPVVMYEGATLSTPKWLHSDMRGSIVAITDATGTATNLDLTPITIRRLLAVK
jgi:YD repeat-containing protein